jgi:sugar lactone lactonase YvrE
MGKWGWRGVYVVLCAVGGSLAGVMGASCSSSNQSHIDSLGNPVYDASIVADTGVSMADATYVAMDGSDARPPDAAADIGEPSVDGATEGSQVAMTCEAGQAVCGVSCVSTQTDINNCGKCGNSCGTAAMSECIRGTCSCNVGYTLCGTTCVNLTSDPANCGLCGYNCQDSQCTQSLCEPSNIVPAAQSRVLAIAIAIDATDIYFTVNFITGSPLMNGVYFKPFASAANAVAISTGDSQPTGIAVSSGVTHVYWTDLASDAIGVSQITADTLASIPVYYEPSGPSGGAIAIVVDAHNLYWIDTTQGTVNQLPLSAMQFPRNADAGTPPQVLASGQQGARGIAVDAMNVYWTVFGTSANAGTVNKVPIGGDNSQVVTLARGEDQPSGIAVDGTDAYVYWVDQVQRAGNSAGGAVKRVSTADGGATPEILAPNQGAPSSIALDDQYVYWTDFNDGTVQKVPRSGVGDGGAIYALAKSQDTPNSIAVDSVNVYWANGSGDIWKVAKGP